MYVPAHFKPSDRDAGWRVIDRNGFGILVTAEAGMTPVASPLPFLARRRQGILLGHLARANPQFDRLGDGQPSSVLVIFQGPSAFVSGAYYRDRSAVPTWDHVTVHVSGTAQLIDGEAATLRVLAQTVAHFEAQLGSEWRLDVERPDLPGMVAQVAAFTIVVERIDAIFKLSQNVEPTQRRRVLDGLRADGHHDVVAAIQAASDPIGAGEIR